MIDDPHHLLSFFEFHPAGYEFLKAMVIMSGSYFETNAFNFQAEVRAVRTSENKSVRYRIVRTSGMSIFENWLRDTQVSKVKLNSSFSPLNFSVRCWSSQRNSNQ